MLAKCNDLLDEVKASGEATPLEVDDEESTTEPAAPTTTVTPKKDGQE